MKKGKVLIAGLAVAITFAATQGFAWMRGPMTNGPMMHGPAMGCDYGVTLTADQQKQAQEIEARYQKQFADRQAAIQAKAAELRTALADSTTTREKINTLRNELFTRKQEYRQLWNQVNQEIGQAIGTTYYGAMGWGPGYCDWHDHGGMSGGYGPRGGSGPGGWRCNW